LDIFTLVVFAVKSLMYIIISTSVYKPEPVVSAQTSSQIAEHLAANDHTVTVITGFPNRPGEILFSY
jgi:hypothetical protein